MKTEAIKFTVTTTDGRLATWDGQQFTDTTPPPKSSLDPVVTIKRAPDVGSSKIRSTVLNPCHAAGKPRAYGDEVEIEPTEFEHLRRAHLVERFREKRFFARVTRAWRAGLPNEMFLPASEFARRRDAGEVTLMEKSHAPTGELNPTERDELVRFVAFVGTRLGLDSAEAGGSAFPRYYESTAKSIPVQPGEVVSVPRWCGEHYERKSFGTILHEGDSVLIDGKPVELEAVS